MADSDKNIIISPQRGSATLSPTITFTGKGNDPITLRVTDADTGTLSFQGSKGQLFAISNSLSSGKIFSANYISGIPAIDVDASGLVRLAPLLGTVGIGTSSVTAGNIVDVGGNVRIAGNLSLTGNVVAPGGVYSAAQVGFYNSTFATNVRNPIWRFGNADGYGFSYFQGSAGVSPAGGGDTIGFHFGSATAAASLLQLNAGSGAVVNGNLGVTGNTGIGTTNPSYKLHVTGTGSVIQRDLYISGNTGGSSGNRLIVGNTDTSFTVQDINLRPTIQAHGAYPVLSLNHTITSNPSHGPTIQFTCNGTGNQFVIGTTGNGSRLDIGTASYGDWNPHNGISNHYGTTIMSFTTSGNIGIGILDPVSKLVISGFGANNTLRFKDGAFEGDVGYINNTGDLTIQNWGNIVFRNGAPTRTETVRISSSGSVRIGTAITIVPYNTLNNGTLSFEGSAGQLFSITNNLTSGSIYSVNDISGIPSIDVDANGTVSLAPYNGNVGIGITNPTSKLHVVGSVSATSFTATSTDTSISIAGSLRATTYNKPAILSVASGTDSSGASIAIQQETAEGWTAIFADFEPYTGWGLYHDNPNNLFCITSENSTGSLRSFTVPSRSSGNRTAHEKIRFDQNNGNIVNGGSISAYGNITAYASDKRLKENFTHIESPLEKVQKLNGYTFDWNAKSEELGFTPQYKQNDVGLIAQEVQEILPQAAVLAPFDSQTNQNGEIVSKSGENYLTIQYERLIPLLVEAIKEQQKQIDSLKDEIEKMKGGN